MQEKNKYNFSEFIHESGLYVTRPIKWKGKDWIKLGVIAAGTFTVYQFDQRIYNVALHNPGYSKNTILFVGKQWGGFFFPPVLTLGLYIHGCIADNNTTKKIGFELAQAIIYSELISFPMKGIAGRSRPKFNNGPSSFHPFTSMADSPRNSFPAGHVDCAFAVSTVLSQNVNSGVLKVLVYAPAVVCAAERIYQGDHWASDCFFGAALGTFTGIWLVKMHEKKESRVQVSSIYPLSVKIALN
jgi:membrane-associated phospholipid phosphatase